MSKVISEVPAVELSDAVNEALSNIEMLCRFAYEQGFHELGYDPVGLVRLALLRRPASGNSENEQTK